MAITHSVVKAPNQTLAAIADWNANHVITEPDTPRRAATLIVAANDSLDTDRADYFCDGVADEVQINQAIAALPATGGSVCLMDGTYNIAAAINVGVNNTTIIGQGRNTQLKTTSAINIINSDNKDGLLVKNIYFEGNGSGAQRGIRFRGDSCVIVNCWFHNFGYYGIECFEASYQGIITNNVATRCLQSGMRLIKFYEGTISGNTCQGCKHGLNFYFSQHSIAVGNAISDSTWHGIYIYQGANMAIMANTIYNCSKVGIHSYGADNLSHVGNYIIDCGQHGIELANNENNCLISGNLIRDCGKSSNNSYSGILLSSGSSYNIISGNRISSGEANSYQYGIREAAVTADYNCVVGNICTDAVTANISLQGVNDEEAHNIV